MVLLQPPGGRAQVVQDLRRAGGGAGVHGDGPRQQEGGAAQVLQLLPAPAGEDDERRDAEVAGRRPGRAGQARLDGVVVHDDQDVARGGGALIGAPADGGALIGGGVRCADAGAPAAVGARADGGAGAQVGQALAPVQDAGRPGARGGALQGVVEPVDEVGGREMIGGDENDVLRVAGDEAGEHVQGPAVEAGVSRLVLGGRQRSARGGRGRCDRRGGLPHGPPGAGLQREVRRRSEGGRLLHGGRLLREARPPPPLRGAGLLGAARRHGERGAGTGMGVDIEVRSIAHVAYDGHDVPVSVMHDEGPRRRPAPPGERRPPSSGPAPRARPDGAGSSRQGGAPGPCDAIPWGADRRASAREG